MANTIQNGTEGAWRRERDGFRTAFSRLLRAAACVIAILVPAWAPGLGWGASTGDHASGRTELRVDARTESRNEAPRETQSYTRIETHGDARIQIRGEIVDPCLGLHWRLVANVQHPDRPGRLILLDGASARPAEQAGPNASAAVAPPDRREESVLAKPWTEGTGTPNAAAISVLPAVIRAGDPVIVDQETPLLHARLGAVALESAGVGQELHVRLPARTDPQPGSGGIVISAIATGAGQVRWSNGGERKP